MTLITADWKGPCEHASLTLRYDHFLPLCRELVFLFCYLKRFQRSKSIPGLSFGRIKSLVRERGGCGGGTEISGFVEYLATLAPDRGLFFGFTYVQGNVSHVSTLLCPLLITLWAVGLSHGNLVQDRFCFYQCWAGSRYISRGGLDLRLTGLKLEGWS